MQALQNVAVWVRKRPLLRWILANLDPVLAGLLAAVFVVLSALDLLEQDALFEAMGGLLVVFAVALFRERVERTRAVRRIERAARAIGAATAWEVIDGHFEWTITSDDGSQATATTRKKMRIIGNQVYSVFEFYKPDGELDGDVSYRGSTNGGAHRALPEMHAKFPGPQARTYRVISLEDMLAPGDIFELESTRRLRNTFPSSREYVRVEIEVPTQKCTLVVNWPANRPPTSLQIERAASSREPVPIEQVKQTSEGSWRFERSFSDANVDEEFLFVWTW